MGIQALPNSTVRALGACQVLNDPAAVIKELLDNALDARATSIAIEISSNTVDSIQVRDNGHGIPPEDRQLAARPHCTSKIGGEDDLKTIGGTSLGFRGEALASVAEMSDSLMISTRVEGEQVAVALKINRQGEVVGQERASLPVGTTVKITGFVKAYPVRNQNALRNSEKCLRKIKLTLQSYAFARPHVRLSLRVLKAKNDKTNWMYAPKAGGNAEDAAFKIVGAPCASQCVRSVVEDRGFTLQAFLPKLDADVSKVSSIGVFLSVDGRPVSAARGTPKQIVKIFREALKKASASFDGVKDPFVYLEITCPLSSYDANVEPAKDDVLFENPNIVVEAARRLFDAVYPSQGPAQPSKYNVGPTPKDSRRSHPTLDEHDFVTSLEVPFSERSSSKLSVQVPSSLIPDDAVQESIDNWEDGQDDVEEPRTRHAFRSNMYGCDEEDLDLLDACPPTGHTEADFEEFRQARKNVHVSNPWVIAKMHAASRRPGQTQADGNAGHGGSVLPGNSQGPESRCDVPPTDLDSFSLPTPRRSSPSPSLENFHPSAYVPHIRLGADGRVIGPQSLPPPQMVMAPPSSFNDENEYNVLEAQRRRDPPAYDYRLSSQAAEPPVGTPLHAIPDVSTKSRRNPPKKLHQTQINKPFVSPLKDQSPREKVWFDHLEGRGHGRQGPVKRRPYPQNGSDGLVNQGELGDLVEDPRPLTPPRRNRDMRDFVTHVDMTEGDSAASLVESRNYPQRKRIRSAGILDRLPSDQEWENSTLPNVLSGSGFVPASELAAMEAHYGSVKHNSRRATKRRKTSEARAMREISGNARAPDGDDEEFRPTTGSRAASRRRRTTDMRCSKSAQLPLERVPAGHGTHHIVVNLSTTNREIFRLAENIDSERSLLGWSETAEGTGNAFAVVPGPAEIEDLSAKLHEVLINRVSDGEMMQNLDMLVQSALTAHKTEVMNVDA